MDDGEGVVDSALALRWIVGVNERNEALDVGRDRRSTVGAEKKLFRRSERSILLEDETCKRDEQALPARVCFSKEALLQISRCNCSFLILASSV